MGFNKFDELTKALATATSRRQAFRRIAGILGGTALAGQFPGLVRANTNSSSRACVNFCVSVFGGDSPEAAVCILYAALHKGLCYTCGPESPGGPKPICCPQNPDGTCTSYCSATCCSGGQVCQDDTCVTPTTTTTASPTTTTTTIGPSTPPPTTTTTTTTIGPTTPPPTTTTTTTTIGPTTPPPTTTTTTIGPSTTIFPTTGGPMDAGITSWG